MLSSPEEHAVSCVMSWEACCCKPAEPSTEGSLLLLLSAQGAGVNLVQHNQSA